MRYTFFTNKALNTDEISCETDEDDKVGRRHYRGVAAIKSKREFQLKTPSAIKSLSMVSYRGRNTNGVAIPMQPGDDHERVQMILLSRQKVNSFLKDLGVAEKLNYNSSEPKTPNSVYEAAELKLEIVDRLNQFLKGLKK